MSVGISVSGSSTGSARRSGPGEGAPQAPSPLVGLPQEALDVLCPLHVVLDPTGHIRHAGPTMQKLRPDTPLAGARFLELFEMSRPRAVDNMASLLRAAGTKLHLRLRDHPRTALKAVLIPLGADTAGRRGAIVNFSFGISIVDALQTYSLHSGDFAPTDLTIEMLYLIEAKTAAMEASRKLNMRLQGAKIAAEEQAYTDTLTGLKNRRAMDHVLARLLRTRTQFSLMHLDLDYFKQVNDTHGHRAGDYVLQHVARVLVEETREEDTVARVGGDEFVLLFPRLVKPARIEEIAASLIKRLEEPVFFEGAECRVSCSMGTALSHHYPQPRAEQMIADADVALYASKKAGRARHSFFSTQQGHPPAR
ncbi:diguanylate cyclase [Pseudooceanicola sediminis]|uniref:Diguanylate cyclase n=1 Tax=Pseudooceanicola sediminis TaxID=2211117 RepID=A0A399J1X4_9RHOB|nr:GGDEF domain-containing protein [Pseudooceanicola sediminis]KAA2316317.1 diguanylate cyclase [Puniceibacterium sp. HSS470]RII39231.1 diguanylate cyclase [Pseudooceanicola sediminis]|tara:strand:- start:266136 stop:267230 length:1095 start_codon:yes stop_codon:yes gene_type:complete